MRRRSLGPYRLVRCLASGAFANVYAAIRRGDNAWVAVKVILPDSRCTDSVRQRLLVEGHLAIGIEHPNLVRYFDVGEEDGAVYVVQELIDGGDVTSLVRQYHGRVPGVILAGIGRDAALGLHALHERGLLHRDVKPANLLLTRSGCCKIADLGLIRPFGEQSGITAAGLVVGTPSFVAPEQIRNDQSLDRRADIYGLAATMYWLATGKTPHTAPNLWAMLTCVVSEPFPDPQLLRPDLPPALAAVIRTAGSKDRDRRQATAEILAAQFSAILANGGAHAAVAVRPPSSSAIEVVPPRVLILGSDPLVRRLYAGRLIVDGWRIEIVADGDAACAAAARATPAVVVLDFDDISTGWEALLRRLRQVPGMALVPVVAIANGGANQVHAVGATRVLDKTSTSPRELSLLMRRLLGQPSRERELSLPLAGLAHAALDRLRPKLSDASVEMPAQVLDDLASSVRGLAGLAAGSSLPAVEAIADAVELLALHLRSTGMIIPETRRTLERSVDALIAVITDPFPGPAWPPDGILVMDNDPLARRLATLALSRMRLTAVCAKSITEAIRVLADNELSLALVNAQMLSSPGAFIAVARQRRPLPVVLTAPSEVLGRLPTGIGIDRIASPFNVAELAAKVMTNLVVAPG